MDAEDLRRLRAMYEGGVTDVRTLANDLDLSPYEVQQGIKNLTTQKKPPKRRVRKFTFKGWNAQESADLWMLIRDLVRAGTDLKCFYSNFEIELADQTRIREYLDAHPEFLGGNACDLN